MNAFKEMNPEIKEMNTEIGVSGAKSEFHWCPREVSPVVVWVLKALAQSRKPTR
jgi:hypothetical protein